jgi:hypothetical protein
MLRSWRITAWYHSETIALSKGSHLAVFPRHTAHAKRQAPAEKYLEEAPLPQALLGMSRHSQNKRRRHATKKNPPDASSGFLTKGIM